jgi:MarR-like DNA-binding transcriptional regulator SgrR of sgrS sRNA
LLTEWEADTQRLMFPVRPRMPMRLQEPLKLVTYDIHMEDAKWIKKSLANFKISIQISELAYTDFANPDNWLDADLVLSGEALDDNLEMALYEWFATQRSLRHCMGDEVRQQLDDKLIQAISLAQKNERMEAFRAMDIFLQQQLVLLPLYHHQQLLHYGDRVQGLNLNSLGWVDFKDIWFT